jgi:ABC-type proline/glycine betaine transport system permease subunit
MPIVDGTRFGAYQIAALIGAGGMGSGVSNIVVVENRFQDLQRIVPTR